MRGVGCVVSEWCVRPSAVWRTHTCVCVHGGCAGVRAPPTLEHSAQEVSTAFLCYDAAHSGRATFPKWQSQGEGEGLSEERTRGPARTSRSHTVACCPRQYGRLRRAQPESGPSLHHLPAGRHPTGARGSLSILMAVRRDWLQAQGAAPWAPAAWRWAGLDGALEGGVGLSSASTGWGGKGEAGSEQPEPHPTKGQFVPTEQKVPTKLEDVLIDVLEP